MLALACVYSSLPSIYLFFISFVLSHCLLFLSFLYFALLVAKSNKLNEREEREKPQAASVCVCSGGHLLHTHTAFG